MKIDLHHILPQGTRRGWRRKKFGTLLDGASNTIHVDHNRHMTGRVPKQNEREFCISAGICRCEYCKNRNYAYLCNEERDAEMCRNFNFSKEKWEAR